MPLAKMPENFFNAYAMTDIVTLSIADWQQRIRPAEQEGALAALERGSVLLFPQLSFPIQDGEDRLLVPTLAGTALNWLPANAPAYSGELVVALRTEK